MVKVPRIPAETIDRLAVLLGVALVVYGVSRWSLPAALILSGTALIAGAIWRKA